MNFKFLLFISNSIEDGLQRGQSAWERVSIYIREPPDTRKRISRKGIFLATIRGKI